jgi:hypothetical protein
MGVRIPGHRGFFGASFVSFGAFSGFLKSLPNSAGLWRRRMSFSMNLRANPEGAPEVPKGLGIFAVKGPFSVRIDRPDFSFPMKKKKSIAAFFEKKK